MAHHPLPKKHAKHAPAKHHPSKALSGLKSVVPGAGGQGPPQKPVAEVNPLLGLINALKAQQAAAMARQVAETGALA